MDYLLKVAQKVTLGSASVGFLVDVGCVQKKRSQTLEKMGIFCFVSLWSGPVLFFYESQTLDLIKFW